MPINADKPHLWKVDTRTSCGYFDAAYLGYEAAEGIDWIWEHRAQDLDQLGI